MSIVSITITNCNCSCMPEIQCTALVHRFYLSSLRYSCDH